MPEYDADCVEQIVAFGLRLQEATLPVGFDEARARENVRSAAADFTGGRATEAMLMVLADHIGMVGAMAKPDMREFLEYAEESDRKLRSRKLASPIGINYNGAVSMHYSPCLYVAQRYRAKVRRGFDGMVAYRRYALECFTDRIRKHVWNLCPEARYPFMEEFARRAGLTDDERKLVFGEDEVYTPPPGEDVGVEDVL